MVDQVGMKRMHSIKTYETILVRFSLRWSQSRFNAWTFTLL